MSLKSDLNEAIDKLRRLYEPIIHMGFHARFPSGSMDADSPMDTLYEIRGVVSISRKLGTSMRRRRSPMADTFDDFPELAAKGQQAEHAAQLLEKAAQAVTAPAPGETWLGVAERLRGAASYAQTATSEILTAAGWFEAAHVAAEAGLLDGDDHG